MDSVGFIHIGGSESIAGSGMRYVNNLAATRVPPDPMLLRHRSLHLRVDRCGLRQQPDRLDNFVHLNDIGANVLFHALKAHRLDLAAGSSV